jgi:folate-binding protein YgfZ
MPTPPIPTPNVDDPWQWQPPAQSLLALPVGLLRLDGPDTLRVLHGQTSQALEGARPGQWLGTCCIGPTGRLGALAEVLVDEGGAWLAIVAGDAEGVRVALDRVLFPADRVRLGPVSPSVLLQPLGADGSTPPPQVPQGTWRPLDGQDGWQLGAAVLLPTGAERPGWLIDRRPLGGDEQERWRLQQGLPAVPGEINGETNPFELGLAARVSLSKGCYVGQETLAKLATYDGVKQQLRRWYAPDPDATNLDPGTRLYAEGSARGGLITSSLRLPGQEGWIGLALVRRSCLQETPLRAGEGPDATEMFLSVPAAFQPPPTGAGGTGGAAS